MKVTELIKAFDAQETLPVDVNAVLECLRANGVDDNIEFIGVDLNPEILLGTMKAFHVRAALYGEPERWVNIYYHRGWSADWQRMICCKELIHLLDPPSAYTSDPQDIAQLAEKIGLPPEMQDPAADGFATNVDRLAEWRAAALLLPLAARELLMPYYKDHKLKIADIARIADMPSKYAGFVMSAGWPTIHGLLTAG